MLYSKALNFLFRKFKCAKLLLCFFKSLKKVLTYFALKKSRFLVSCDLKTLNIIFLVVKSFELIFASFFFYKDIKVNIYNSFAELKGQWNQIFILWYIFTLCNFFCVFLVAEILHRWSQNSIEFFFLENTFSIDSNKVCNLFSFWKLSFILLVQIICSQFLQCCFVQQNDNVSKISLTTLKEENNYHRSACNWQTESEKERGKSEKSRRRTKDENVNYNFPTRHTENMKMLIHTKSDSI